MPEAIPSFEIMARKAQDMAQVKVSAAKNMAFAFDIDGVLVHGDRLIPEGKKVLEILNGDNELGIKVCSHSPPVHRRELLLTNYLDSSHFPHERLW
jgi:hypothetical protein